MNYYRQFDKMIDFIGEHLDEELSLEQLSHIFCVSKFHFHRLFTAFTGVSLQQYIRWLRLKRAAYQLFVDKEQSIIHIAINAGFESHEAFSRAFKKACGLSPKQFRQCADWSYWNKTPYCLPELRETIMNIEIKTMPKIRLAVVEHRGDPNLVVETLNKLMSWAKTNGISLKPKEAYAIAYDDPKTTPAEKFRFDLGIKVPENLKLIGCVVEKYIPTGLYAIALHKGSHKKIGETVHALYREVPKMNKDLGDFPCVFCYHNFTHEVAETALLTECCLLLN